MPSITAIITTYNEALHITEAIASVDWCDSVLVVDSHSADNTLQLAQAAGAKVIQRAYDGPAQQKNFAIEQTDSDWLLILDADERVTPELRTEIQGILASANPQHNAYWIHRRNHFMGQEIRYSGWQGDKVIRLFRKGECVYGIRHVHEEMECKVEPGKLKAKLLHYTYTDMQQYLVKLDRYASLSAKDRLPKTPKVTSFHLHIKPIFRFFRHYILRGGVLDGKAGLVISTLSAYSVFLRYLKLDRLRNGEEI